MRWALAYGADAVYAGQPQFSLRSRDNGFSQMEHVANAIEICRKAGRKFYLTSNIFPHNNKVAAFRSSLDEYIALGPDALIMSDPGMISWVHARHPQIPIHLSVQANCTNWASAEFWYSQGVSRIILSRELHLREIEEIHRAVPKMELEAFVHGAVCMAHSGRCMLSQYRNHRDANQGMCNNSCRFPYAVHEQKSPVLLEDRQNPTSPPMEVEEDSHGTYFMSSRDLCSIGILDQLAEAGVISFKIEGRTKSLYYLAQVVRAYRGALDDVQSNRAIDDIHLWRALCTESRGYMPGYLPLENEAQQNYEESRSNSLYGRVAALVDGYNLEKRSLCVSPRENVEAGESLLLVSPQGEWTLVADGLVNHRELPATTLPSGTRNCLIAYPKDPGPHAYLMKIGGKPEASVLANLRRRAVF